jgi:hypothetical protein
VYKYNSTKLYRLNLLVVAVTTISKLDSLRKQFQFVSFIDSLPLAVVGIIQGVLPVAALAALLALVPIILRCK